MGRVLLATLACSLIAGSAASAQTNNADIKWVPAVGFPAGAQMAVLSGDPGKSGLFTVRLRMPAGFAIAPHWHPTDELVTVVDGEVSLGMGDAIDKAKSATLMQGGYVVAPAKMHHYAYTSSGGTVQVTGMGPFAITYVNPKDDPRTK
ncbi:MAG TPA: cupin domain-containing protein [Sphingomicrobium sp.]